MGDLELHLRASVSSLPGLRVYEMWTEWDLETVHRVLKFQMSEGQADKEMKRRVWVRTVRPLRGIIPSKGWRA